MYRYKEQWPEFYHDQLVTHAMHRPEPCFAVCCSRSLSGLCLPAQGCPWHADLQARRSCVGAELEPGIAHVGLRRLLCSADVETDCKRLNTVHVLKLRSSAPCQIWPQWNRKLWLVQNACAKLRWLQCARRSGSTASARAAQIGGTTDAASQPAGPAR